MFVNNIKWLDADLPFGGIQDDGNGRELRNMGIQEFRQQEAGIYEPLGGIGMGVGGADPDYESGAGPQAAA